MKVTVLSLLAFLSSAAAFVPAPQTSAVTGPLDACISKDEIMKTPNTLEFGGVWDPLNLASIGSDETLAWYRAAEIKHGRVAMAAFVGWWAVAAGLHFPGELSYGTAFASVPTKGLEAWDAFSGAGKAQILGLIGLIEFHDELFASRRSTHYMRGGTPGVVRDNPLSLFLLFLYHWFPFPTLFNHEPHERNLLFYIE